MKKKSNVNKVNTNKERNNDESNSEENESEEGNNDAENNETETNDDESSHRAMKKTVRLMVVMNTVRAQVRKIAIKVMKMRLI